MSMPLPSAQAAPRVHASLASLRRVLQWRASVSAFVLGLLAALGVPAPAQSAAGQPSAHRAPRVVLALSDASEEEHLETEDPVSLLVAQPLQHLGYVVRRWPIERGLPPEALLDDAAAVLTWFGTRPVAPEAGAWVRPWLLNDVLGRGLRLVLLGEPGPLERDAHGAPDPAGWDSLVRALGMVETDAWNSDPALVEVEHTDPLRSALEAPIVQRVHRGVRADALPAGAEAWVKTRAAADPTVAAPVVTGPFGGLGLNPYVLSIGTDLGDRRWHVDLFAFLRAALGGEGRPAFDPCVVNGQRLFFVQVDGDGFESYSTVHAGQYAAEVFLDEVIDRYALPFTISVIAASVADSLTEDFDDPRIALARTILTRPNVEVASHGVLHPLKWNRPYTEDIAPRTVTWYGALRGYRFSPRNEVTASIPFIDRIVAGTGRRTTVMLWTGDAIPDAEVLAATRELGLANVNGGTYRWDAASDSVGYVRPLVRIEGDELQVFCGGPNENVYDGFFDRHPGAFRHLATSLERTGSPRILKPANVYVHFYAAERPERLRSIQDLIERFGVQEESAPVFASDWYGAAHDAFRTAELSVQRSERSALILARGFGRCRTLRFDDEVLDVDLVRSPGVLGARRIGRALYVHLAAVAEATVALEVAPPAAPHLVSANHIAQRAERDARGLAWDTESRAPRTARLAGFAPGAALEVVLDGKRHNATADAEGRIELTAGPGSGRWEVRAR